MDQRYSKPGYYWSWFVSLNIGGELMLLQTQMSFGPQIDWEELQERQEAQAAEIEQERQAARTARFPNMDPKWGENGFNHLEALYGNTKQFFINVKNAADAQATSTESTQYLNTIREMTLPSIPADQYQHFFVLLPLDLVDFVITFIYPEHQDYLNYRWLRGFDKRPGEWLKERIETIDYLTATGKISEAETWKKDTLLNIQKYAPGLIEKLDTPSKALFIQTVLSEPVQVQPQETTASNQIVSSSSVVSNTPVVMTEEQPVVQQAQRIVQDAGVTVDNASFTTDDDKEDNAKAIGIGVLVVIGLGGLMALKSKKRKR